MYLSSWMSTRNQLGEHLNRKGLLNEAVEVGTHRGAFAETLLRSWSGQVLHCVDPWLPHPQMPGHNREADLCRCRARLEQFSYRAKVHRCTSAEAAANLRSLDFVYIDGDHSAEAVRYDLRVWYEKLVPGGVLAGHDWMMPSERSWAEAVQAEVAAFSVRVSLDVNIIVEENGLPWSFYMEKPR